MKGSLLVGALCALGAVASPINKRVVVVTDVELDVVTVTITETPGASATSATPVVLTTSITSTISSAAETSAANVNNNFMPAPSASSSSSTLILTTSTVAPQPTTTVVPTTTAVVETSTSSSATASATGASTYQTMLLDAHNIHRANHSASDLIWNTTLAESALALANTCSYGHNTALGPAANYGQNIGYGVNADVIDEMITNLMYNDEMMNYQGLYGEANPSMTNFDSWGHFSQIVWKDTTSVGCATVTCDPLANSGSSLSLPYTVCNYYPAGNYGGEYGTNVGEPLGEAMVVAS